MTKKTAILLINLGTPDSPKVADVRRYLTQFLNDPRVIDLPWLGRKLLVNGIIVPFRAPKSAKEYQKLFDLCDGESPLLTYGIELRDKLQALYNSENITVELAMRYGNPSIKSVLEKIRQRNYDKVVVVPLYPHYASSSSGTVLEEVMKHISKWWVIPEIKLVGQFYDHPEYLKAFKEVVKNYNHEDYDHVLLSYHGLPERHVDKVYVDNTSCSEHNCENGVSEESKLCYKAACFETTKLLINLLNLPKEKCTTSFQSRLGKDPWIKPYTDMVLEDLAKQGKKKILVYSPAFVADCLETLIEIGSEYNHEFQERGGEKVQLVESLNAHDAWVNGLKNILSNYI